MPKEKETPKMKYTEAQVASLLHGIFTGEVDEYNIPEELYSAISDYLLKALYDGFGGTLADFEGKDYELLNELRENIYMFSAAKSYQQLKDIGSLMFDENGDRVSINDFSKLGAERFDTWNDAYGRTEYNTAVASAEMAGKWNEVERNKDLLPYLRYSTIGDACDICAPLDGMTAKVDDAIWNTVTPPNHFNCLCVLTQEEADIEETPTDEKDAIFAKVDKEMDDTFKFNPGKEKVVFSEDHPYFQVPKEDREYAENNFNLPIPKTDK